MSDTPGAGELEARLERFRGVMEECRVPAALITNGCNVRYLSGFSGRDSALLVTPRQRFLLTDFRYIEEARRDIPGWTIIVEKSRRGRGGKEKELIPRGLMDKAGYVARKLRLRKLGVEAEDMRVADMRALRRAAHDASLRPQYCMVAQLRVLKSDWEVRQIEKALRIQEFALLELCRVLDEKTSEREAAARLRYLMVMAGAEDEAFDSMVLFGPRSSLPHGRPGSQVLGKRGVALVDWGARKTGYHSDLTRTFFFGTISRRLRDIHEVVGEAQRQAISRIAPGAPLSDVDAAARAVIRKAGFGKAFGHSTGHGLGLEVHEAPAVSARAKGMLRAGMVVTVEPGVYLPGIGGVRIEDDVLVTPQGHRVLSRLDRGLRWNGNKD